MSLFQEISRFSGLEGGGGTEIGGYVFAPVFERVSLSVSLFAKSLGSLFFFVSVTFSFLNLLSLISAKKLSQRIDPPPFFFGNARLFQCFILVMPPLPVIILTKCAKK